jgi:transglutaminase-like putative cysteine protease
MLYTVTHTTTYAYADAVSLCHNLVHLRPRNVPRQTCHDSQLIVTPEPRAVTHQHDYFGNPISLFTIQEPHKKLQITATHRIETTHLDVNTRGADGVSWEQVRDAVTSDRALLDICQFTWA